MKVKMNVLNQFSYYRKIEIDKNIIKQSLKLKIMEKMTSMGNGKWTKDKSDDHKEKMFDIFRNDISDL